VTSVEEYLSEFFCCFTACLFADNTGYIPAAAMSVPTSPHAAASFSGFFPSPVVMSSQMLKNAQLVDQGLHCLASTALGAVIGVFFGSCI